MDFYSELISRNWAFLTPADQEKVQMKRVGIAGCGMGSLIAELATRTGFTQFVVADGDNVEVSNLNRQAFDTHYLGKNKARSTAEIIHSINPEAEVRIVDKFLRNSQEMISFLEDVDIALNTIDINSDFMQFNRIADQQGVPTLFPLNIGWGSVVLVFSAQSPSLEELLGFKRPEEKTEGEIFNRLIEVVVQRHFPPYLEPLLRQFKAREKKPWPSDPQLGVAVYLGAVLIITIMVQLALGMPTQEISSFIGVDALTLARR